MKLLNILLYCSLIGFVFGHYPEFMTTPASQLERLCQLSDVCVHDTIPVCGRLGDETRTFLDLCDLMEYSCDHNQMFLHVEEVEGCPPKKEQ